MSGVDMVVQGFEELNVEYLQLIYMRHHGLPWIIAKTDRICIRESVEDLTAFRKLYQEEGMLDYLPNPEFEGEEGRENFRHYIRSMYRFIITGSGQCSSEKAVQLSEESALKTENIRDRAYWNLAI